MFVMLIESSRQCMCIAMCWNMFWLVIRSLRYFELFKLMVKAMTQYMQDMKNQSMCLCKKKHFESIEIDIRTDTGKPIPFEYGKVIVTLHFRLRKIPYLLQ